MCNFTLVPAVVPVPNENSNLHITMRMGNCVTLL